MLAFGYEKVWSRIIIRMVVLNFVCIFALMYFMRPVRAIALTTTLMDIFAAGSCILFYRRTAGTRGRSGPVAPVEAVEPLALSPPACRRRMKVAIAAICLLCSILFASCGSRDPGLAPPPELPELWCWLHTNCAIPPAPGGRGDDRSLVARAITVSLSGCRVHLLASPSGPIRRAAFCARQWIIHRQGNESPCAEPAFGYSNDALTANPNMARECAYSARALKWIAQRRLVFHDTFPA